MSAYDQNSGWGQAQIGGIPHTLGKVFVLADNSATDYGVLQQLYTPYQDGIDALYSTWAAVISQCSAGRGDIVIVHPSFTTLPSSGEYASLQTKGVTVHGYASTPGTSVVIERAAATLPQSTTGALFGVSGAVEIVQIVGVVTTAIQNQANNTKIVFDPATGTNTDLCAVTSIANLAVDTVLNITGTFANALVTAANGAVVSQATAITVYNGDILLSCAASNTGAIKWRLAYRPLEPNAYVVVK
jgi:hypothetical protein